MIKFLSCVCYIQLLVHYLMAQLFFVVSIFILILLSMYPSASVEFADNVAILARSKIEWQRVMRKLEAKARSTELEISTGKTKNM